MEPLEWTKGQHICDECEWKVTDWGDHIWKGDRDMYSISLVLTRMLLILSKFLRILLMGKS